MSDSGRSHHRDATRRRERSRSRSPRRDHHRHDEYDRRRSASPRREFSEVRWRDITARKAVPLDQYRKDYRAGKYAGLSFRDKMTMFGSGSMPIFVPLAPGETEDQYETRFRAWLLRLENHTIEELRAHGDPFRERRLRIDFANANVHGYERFDQFDWSKHTTNTDKRASSSAQSHDHKNGQDTKVVRQSTSTKKHEDRSRPKEEPEGGLNEREVKATIKKTPTRVCPSKDSSAKSGLTPTALTEMQLTCGCTPCLFAVLDHMAHRVHEIESAHATSDGAARVVDLTHEK